MTQYLAFAILLACPLMMLWMMRHGRGHGHTGGRTPPEEGASTDELHRRREALERQIAEREAAAGREHEPVPGGRS